MPLVETLTNFTNPSINFNVAKHFSLRLFFLFSLELQLMIYKSSRRNHNVSLHAQRENQKTQRKRIASTCSKLQLDDQFSSYDDDDANQKWKETKRSVLIEHIY
jgi:hypothetical protein